MKSSIESMLKRMIPTHIARYSAYKRLIRNQESFLYTSGWMASLKSENPVDASGQPVPWMNYSVRRFFEDRLHDGLVLFEYGSGNSTLFFAKRVQSVTSVEYDKDWFDLIQSKKPVNVELLFSPQDIDGAYCRAIKQSGKAYDIVVVDGRDRVNCVKQSIQSLTPRGVIVLDDSHRERYAQGLSFAASQGFRVLHFEGLKPTGKSIDKTSILYRDDNCFGL